MDYFTYFVLTLIEHSGHPKSLVYPAALQRMKHFWVSYSSEDFYDDVNKLLTKIRVFTLRIEDRLY